MTDAKRFILLGTGGIFTRSVLRRLLERQRPPQAYLQSAATAKIGRVEFTGTGVEIEQPGNEFERLLMRHGVRQYPHARGRLTQLLERYPAEFLLVACWPDLLPRQVIDSVACAALNLHPSLLPLFRGANPVADQLASDDRRFGVTLHLLNDRFDQGDIILQKPIAANIGENQYQIEIEAAYQGADLFIEAMDSYHDPGWRVRPQS